MPCHAMLCCSRDHFSAASTNLIYWKETKNFADGCSAHILGGTYRSGNMALPDQATPTTGYRLPATDYQPSRPHCRLLSW